MFNDLLPIIQNILPHSVQAWSVILGSALTVSVVLQVIKHFGKLQDAKKTVTFLLAALSFIASYSDTVYLYISQHASLLQAASMGWVMAAAVVIHRFMVSPLYGKIVNFLDGIYADALTYRQEQAALKAQTVDMTVAEQPAAPVVGQEFTLPS